MSLNCKQVIHHATSNIRCPLLAGIRSHFSKFKMSTNIPSPAADESKGLQAEDVPKKRRKSTSDKNSLDEIKNLSTFKLDKILINNSQQKVCFLQGTFAGRQDPAIVILEKKAFAEASLNHSGYFSEESVLNKDFINDIYGNFECIPEPSINGIKTTIIYPATEKHIQKFTEQKQHIINETPELHKTLTYPHLIEEQFSPQWVYNILDHSHEKDRIIFEDPSPDTGFVMIPDLKWDGKTLETLYLLALVHNRELKSIRCLNSKHLALLKNIRDKGIKAIHDKYGINGDQLRIFFHYQPSFYHLHVHFTYLKHEAPGVLCEKAHLLDTVINNIQLLPDYYQKATIPFIVLEKESLFENLQKCGFLPKSISKVNN